MAPQREWFEKDYYKVLGVSDSATDKEITKAYRKLAKQHHPDAHPGSEERFKDISAAYDVLGDAQRRKEYDEVRRMGPMAGAGFGGGAPGGGFSPGGFQGGGSFGIDDIGDLLGGLFNRGRSGSRQSSGPRRGGDLSAELNMSFMDAVKGLTTTLTLTSDAPCSTCQGTGAAPGTKPSICQVCKGRGVLDDNQGLFSFSQPCQACGGNGMRIDTPCPTCGGIGVEHQPRPVKVRIPPGVESGQRIRLKGKGSPGQNGGPPGDLYVTVRVGSHAMFGRKGSNLTITIPLTYSEAALGAQVKVPTLDKPVTLKIPPGTPSGKTFRVKGAGVPDAKRTGALLVTVEVAVPQKLSKDERKLIEALADANKESPRENLGV